jgi:hypothetical protein
MKIIIVVLFSIIPYFTFAQGYRIKVKDKGKDSEFSTDSIPGDATFSERVKKFSIKKEKKDSVSNAYIVQIGEEEHSFPPDGAYHEVEFSHDIRGLVVYILNDKRDIQGKPFILKKPKKQ